MTGISRNVRPEGIRSRCGSRILSCTRLILWWRRVSYLRTDSLGKRTMFTDTTKFFYKDKPLPRGKRNKEKDSIPEIKFMEIKAGLGATVDLNRSITLEFDRPIFEEGLKSIKLSEKVDSVWVPTDFNVKHDS